MTKLILIRGNAASGKSSLAARLQAELGPKTLLLSQDLLRRTLLNAKDGPDTPTISLLADLLDWGQANCDHIILEGILRSDWYAPIFDNIAEQFAGHLYAYYYDLPFEETLRRHATRPKATEFGEEALRRWWVEKDYLDHITEKTLTADLNLQQSQQLILTDLIA